MHYLQLKNSSKMLKSMNKTSTKNQLFWYQLKRQICCNLQHEKLDDYYPYYWKQIPTRTKLEEQLVNKYDWSYPCEEKDVLKGTVRSVYNIETDYLTQHMKNYGGCFFYTSLNILEPMLITPGMFWKLTHVPVYDIVGDQYQLVGGIDVKTRKYVRLEAIPHLEKQQIIMEVFDQCVHGSILGDLSVSRLGRIKVTQKQCEYTMHKYFWLRQFCRKSKPYYHEQYDAKTEKWKKCWTFSTASIFKHYRSLYYYYARADKKLLQKAVPQNIQKMLISGISLAILMQDDGYKEKNTMLISTDCFKDQVGSLELLVHALKQNFNLDTTVQKSGRIRISRSSYDTLDKLIRPYFLPIFLYKLSGK